MQLEYAFQLISSIVISLGRELLRVVGLVFVFKVLPYLGFRVQLFPAKESIVCLAAGRRE